MTKVKKVSIIVVTWNGKKHLEYCLPSLKKITYPNYEVVVVDNASADGSQAYVKKNHSWVKLIENEENLGYVGGNNIGMENSDGDYILILNNDIEVTSDFLQPLTEVMEEDRKIGCLEPKTLCLKDKKTLDLMGSYFTDTGFLYHYGYLQPASLPVYNQRHEVFCAKGACILLRRDILDKIGKFDDDYFIFFEETDLCHRLWLAGYKVIYEPKSVIYHYGAGDTGERFSSARRAYLALRNRLDSYIKNLESWNLVKVLLALSLFYLGLFFLKLFTGKFDQVWAIIKAVFWNITHLPKTLKKRAFVQSLRKVSDEKIFQKVKRNPPLAYYYYLFTDLKNYQYPDVS